MEKILDCLQQTFHQYWWFVLIAAIIIAWTIYEFIKAPLYGVCPRCGSMLKADFITDKDCYFCTNLSDKDAEILKKNI